MHGLNIINNMARSIGFDLDSVFLRFHKLGLRAGIQIVPNHYYSSVADINYLAKNRNNWAKKSNLPGIISNLDNQIINLKKICIPFQREYLGNKNYFKAVSDHFGPGFGFIEAQALHGIIRYYKPNRIIEVGSGVSTYCSLKATEMNHHGNITCIEPFPSDKLKSLSSIELIENEVQKVSLDTFDLLDNNDLLFIDSTHTVKTGSDVNYIILEVLPRLKPGVIIHFHDIFLPYDYQIDILRAYFQWSETSLLRAFLINNNKSEIIFSLSQLHEDKKEALLEVFPEYDPLKTINGITEEPRPWKAHFPASIYIKII